MGLDKEAGEEEPIDEPKSHLGILLVLLLLVTSLACYQWLPGLYQDSQTQSQVTLVLEQIPTYVTQGSFQLNGSDFDAKHALRATDEKSSLAPNGGPSTKVNEYSISIGVDDKRGQVVALATKSSSGRCTVGLATPQGDILLVETLNNPVCDSQLALLEGSKLGWDAQAALEVPPSGVSLSVTVTRESPQRVSQKLTWKPTLGPRATQYRILTSTAVRFGKTGLSVSDWKVVTNVKSDVLSLQISSDSGTLTAWEVIPLNSAGTGPLSNIAVTSTKLQGATAYCLLNPTLARAWLSTDQSLGYYSWGIVVSNRGRVIIRDSVPGGIHQRNVPYNPLSSNEYITSMTFKTQKMGTFASKSSNLPTCS